VRRQATVLLQFLACDLAFGLVVPCAWRRAFLLSSWQYERRIEIGSSEEGDIPGRWTGERVSRAYRLFYFGSSLLDDRSDGRRARCRCISGLSRRLRQQVAVKSDFPLSSVTKSELRCGARSYGLIIFVLGVEKLQRYLNEKKTKKRINIYQSEKVQILNKRVLNMGKNV